MNAPFLPLVLALAPVPFTLQGQTKDAAAAPTLEARIEAIRAEAGLPALGGALVTVDGLEGVWVTGKRRAGGEEKVAAGDLWHLGSCTKSMTATLIALLVTRGDLAWETPLAELLPELATEMDVDYFEVDLVDLLCHRAGIPANPSNLGASLIDQRDLVEQRAELTHSVLASPPVHPPKGALLYSNSGFIIAGHVAEVATGKSWEELVRTLLFQPLGMESAGFGPPGTKEKCDQPRGHLEDGTWREPGPLADNPPIIGPAGSVHASLADWAKYIQLHLKGARADVKVGEITLTRETFARLHTPYDGAGMSYGFGWGIEKRPWAGGDGTALWHNGSNTMWYCLTWLGLGNGVAALATTNVATPKARGAADQLVGLLIQEHERRAKSGAAR
jgi:CubicO group peptidase (beta-lactamase class C family)